MQKYLPEFAALGASLIGVSPQTPDGSAETIDEWGLTFEMLSDKENKIARAYGLVFELDKNMRPLYESWGIDIPKSNGDPSYELPIPATYLIDKSGLIKFAFLDTDHTIRMEPSDIIEQLANM
mgnify:CR=1 FL=1